MRNRVRSCLAVVGLVVAVGAGAGRAAVTYSYNYVAGVPAYTVAAGGTVLVPIYLQEVTTTQPYGSLLGTEGGLFSAAVRATLFSGSAANAIVAATANPAFTDPSSAGTFTATSASVTEFAGASGVTAGPQANGVARVLLGTVAVRGAGQVGVSTVYALAGITDPASGAGTTFTNANFYDLDNAVDRTNPAGASGLYASAGSNTVTVTTVAAVPEPVAVGAAAAGAVAGLSRRWRRPR